MISPAPISCKGCVHICMYAILTMGFCVQRLQSGSHFVAVHKEFNILEPDTLVTNGSARYAFFNALPDLVVHPAPLQEGDVKAKMKSECQCLQYCWENK